MVTYIDRLEIQAVDVVEFCFSGMYMYTYLNIHTTLISYIHTPLTYIQPHTHIYMQHIYTYKLYTHANSPRIHTCKLLHARIHLQCHSTHTCEYKLFNARVHIHTCNVICTSHTFIHTYIQHMHYMHIHTYIDTYEHLYAIHTCSTHIRTRCHTHVYTYIHTAAYIRTNCHMYAYTDIHRYIHTARKLASSSARTRPCSTTWRQQQVKQVQPPSLLSRA
jgi:hypothetical protein